MTYTPNVINQYTTADTSGVTNGSEHEISSAWGANYTYINDGQLSQIDNGTTSTQYAYDALRRLVRRGVNGATNRYEIYDGERSILEYNINGGIVGRNVYGKGIDEILMRTAPGINGGLPFYYQQDHEGSVTHLTNASGSVIEKYKYDAFGAATYLNPSGTDIGASAYGNVYLFTGRRKLTWDTYEYRARIYNSYLGRFMSEDPKLFDAGDYNLFRYCHNDPLDLTDPMGTQIGSGAEQMYTSRSEDRLWDLQKHFDSSNNSPAYFPGFGGPQGLSFSYQARTDIKKVHFDFRSELEGKTPRELGMQAVKDTERDFESSKQYGGYAFYRLNGRLVSVHGGAYWDDTTHQMKEVNVMPQGGKFLAYGHLHVPGRAGHAFSDLDKEGFGRMGPVLKRNDWDRRGRGYFDEFDRGVTSLVRPDGTTEKTY